MTRVAALPAVELAVALRRDAMRSGDWHRVAAVDLLTRHGYWPRRDEFLDLVTVSTDPAGDRSAWLNLDTLTEAAALRLEAPASAMAVLRVACSLAGRVPLVPTADEDDPIRWSLSSMFRDLDTTSSALVADAIQQAVSGQTGVRAAASTKPKPRRRLRVTWSIVALVAALTAPLDAFGAVAIAGQLDDGKPPSYVGCNEGQQVRYWNLGTDDHPDRFSMPTGRSC